MYVFTPRRLLVLCSAVLCCSVLQEELGKGVVARIVRDYPHAFRNKLHDFVHGIEVRFSTAYGGGGVHVVRYRALRVLTLHGLQHRG